jgi:DNA polymerase-4
VDIDDADTLHSTLCHLAEKAAKRLRDSGLYARTVTVTIRYKSFKTITRAKSLREPTDLDSVILATAKELFLQNRDHRQQVRLLGVALSQFEHAAPQLDLLDAGRRDRQEKLARATDRLRDKFGFSKLQRGGSLRLPEDE